MKTTWRILSGTVAIWLLVWVLSQPTLATTTLTGSPQRSSGFSAVAQVDDASSSEFIVSDPVIPTTTAAVRDLPPAKIEPRLDREINPRMSFNWADPNFRSYGGIDPLLAAQAAAPAPSDRSFDTPLFNFNGQGYTFLNPPDTVGDVGTNHYIQMINATIVSIYDKATAALITSFDLTALGGCATGSGDPVVLYDQAADRWLLSEFGSGNSLCVFISQTPDPTGAYYSYRFTTPTFPDYPKFGVWPDAYYVTTNESNPTQYALDRSQMLAGLPATSQRFTAPRLAAFPFQTMTPSDLDGATPPPTGAPNYIMRHRDDEVHNAGSNDPLHDFLELWAFHVDWTTPANSTFTQIANIPVSEFDSDLCGLSSFSCIPQPGTSTRLDPLREVIMFRLAYRNFGDHETLLGNFVTDTNGSDHAGVRWFELRKVGSAAWSLYQEGTYAPDSVNRWMGSVAMDGSGNIALGYNVSDSTSTFPGLRYVGRLSSDPLGTMPQGENVLVNGTAANGSNRYGDYSAMSVDPVDDCTFWFTGEWNGASTWSTRIGAFKFDACGSPDFTLAAAPNSQAICAGADALYDITVGSVQGFNDPVTLSAMGQPAGTTTGFSVNPVIPPGSSQLTIGNTAGAAPGSYTIDIDGNASTGTKTASVGLDLFTTAPGAATLLTPADGATNVSVQPTFTWAPHPQANTYELAIATAPNQASIVHYVSGLTQPSYTLPASAQLDPSTTYYWTVRSTNPCGRRLSAVHSFTTVAAVCTAPNLAIPDGNTTGVVSTLTVPTGGSLTDLDVYIRATHTWVGDLAFELTHVDTGTSAVIFNRPGVPGSTFGCSGDNVNVTINDEGTDGAVETTCNNLPAISGSLVGGDPPNNTLLSAFDGESLAGTWTLRAVDFVTPDPGTLNVWCLVGATSP